MTDEHLTADDVARLKSEGWYDLGFTGLFSILAEVGNHGEPMTEDRLEAFEARLPARVPFGTNSQTLAWKIVDRMPEPSVLIIRADAAAIMDLVEVPAARRDAERRAGS